MSSQFHLQNSGTIRVQLIQKIACSPENPVFVSDDINEEYKPIAGATIDKYFSNSAISEGGNNHLYCCQCFWKVDRTKKGDLSSPSGDSNRDR